MSDTPTPVEIADSWIGDITAVNPGDSRSLFACLEAAGYRVVGPHINQAMLEAGRIETNDTSKAVNAWQQMLKAAPTWGTK